MVDFKHPCLVTSARSKSTILKRLRAMTHPSSKAPLVGVHRIYMDRLALAADVEVSLNPGVVQDLYPEGLYSQVLLFPVEG